MNSAASNPGGFFDFENHVPSTGGSAGTRFCEDQPPFVTASQGSQESNQLLLLRRAQVFETLSGVVCFTIVALDCVV